MPKLTLRSQLFMANEELNQLRGALYTRDTEIKILNDRLRYMDQTQRRFDQLLDGMCMGMKEANLPRKPL